MRFQHTHRPGFWLGFIDFFTAGLFFLLYMPLGGLQEELDEILGRRTQRYWVAYLLGIPTAFIYPLVWMSRIAEELKAKAIDMGIEGPYTSWWHMFGWNVFGILLMGPAVATQRFFDTLNKKGVEIFKGLWKLYIGDCDIIYTRSAEGRRVLLKARKYAFSAINKRASKRLSKWQ